ncbi:N-acetylglucosamine kinase [Paenibacillus protaetiae]|uniref:ATPase n=1 Tax=Paenibacillus protaetiae TaxID=2509456 RepID=A0A4P6EWB7_9BACL|nr:BadF/BadG/BcrA/BcrD ATPase family protein [Paenibacillus protaetiae]QAY66996.1 ATPase [Paenibacillus protaetiae]
MKYVAGWDGGGTKTAVAIMDESGTVVHAFASGAINLNGRGEAEVRGSIREMLAAMGEICGGLERCVQLCIGAAGVSNPSVAVKLTAMVREAGYAGGLTITGDQETALAGALDGEAGMILIAGTGSICYGRNREGAVHRSGGGGYLIDDEGSGYSIGRELIAAVLKAADGRLANEAIAPRVYRKLGLQTANVRELIGFVYNPQTDKRQIAALAPLLIQLCEEGDAAAIAIAERSAAALFELVVPVAKRLSLQSGQLALAGGILVHHAAVRERLLELLRQQYPDLQCVMAKQDASCGAAMMALRRLEAE